MTFKSNWEKSETNHQLPEGIVSKMVNLAYPDKKLESYELIAGGCANLNIKIQLEGNKDLLILRIYLRDKDAAHRERNIGNLLKDNIPVPEIYYIGEVDNYCFAFIKFMPGMELRKLLLGKEAYDLDSIMYEVGELLTKFASHKFTKAGFFDQNLEVIEELSHDSLRKFSLLCLENIAVQKYLSAEIIAKIKSLLMSMPIAKDTNVNLVHADFDPANIFVSEIDGKWKVSAILDWEFSYAGSWLNDVANILRYSHEMPKAFEKSFLKGVEDSGLKLPKDWRGVVNEYNLASLLDSMTRHDLESLPNIREDICNLINHIVSELDYINS
jgi:Ser/Thr protein kinase RdoA (MazF antagonist)